jgi:predicted transcriptional regulator
MSDQTTGFSVSDIEYNLITTLSNLLQSEEVLARYTTDAEEAGEPEVAAAFRQLRDHNQQVALRLRESLHRLISKA